MNILKHIVKNTILGALGGCLGRILEALGGVLEACGAVLEALGGVLEAKTRQDSAKMLSERAKSEILENYQADWSFKADGSHHSSARLAAVSGLVYLPS